MMEENKDWATPSLKEAPYWRDGMTPEEYDVEREYLARNWETLVETGKYKPLWKQREEAEKGRE